MSHADTLGNKNLHRLVVCWFLAASDFFFLIGYSVEFYFPKYNLLFLEVNGFCKILYTGIPKIWEKCAWQVFKVTPLKLPLQNHLSNILLAEKESTQVRLTLAAWNLWIYCGLDRATPVRADHSSHDHIFSCPCSPPSGTGYWTLAFQRALLLYQKQKMCSKL